LSEVWPGFIPATATRATVCAKIESFFTAISCLFWQSARSDADLRSAPSRRRQNTLLLGDTDHARPAASATRVTLLIQVKETPDGSHPSTGVSTHTRPGDGIGSRPPRVGWKRYVG